MWISNCFAFFLSIVSVQNNYPSVCCSDRSRVCGKCACGVFWSLNASHLRIYPLCLNVSHLRIYPLCFLFSIREALALLLLKSSPILPALATLISQESGYFPSLSLSLSHSLTHSLTHSLSLSLSLSLTHSLSLSLSLSTFWFNFCV